jgi:20S proteasome alpha/beta subunit
MKEKFYIKTKGGYVAGINEEHVIVILSETKKQAKSFINKKHAQYFIDIYDGAGYGLNKEDCKVV